MKDISLMSKYDPASPAAAIEWLRNIKSEPPLLNDKHKQGENDNETAK